MAQMVSTSERTGLLNRVLRVRVPSGAQDRLYRYMFNEIIISKYSDKVEEFLKILGKDGLACSKAGVSPLQGESGGFDSLSVHKLYKI